ncbi:MAG: hypothetical protein ACRCXZ_09400, partial [Patescibacteria group bacterium]
MGLLNSISNFLTDEVEADEPSVARHPVAQPMKTAAPTNNGQAIGHLQPQMNGDPINDLITSFLGSLVKYKDQDGIDKLYVKETVGVNFPPVPSEQEEAHKDMIRQEFAKKYKSLTINPIRRGESYWEAEIEGYLNLLGYVSSLKPLKRKFDVVGFNKRNFLEFDSEQPESLFVEHNRILQVVEDQLAVYCSCENNFPKENRKAPMPKRTWKYLKGHSVVILVDSNINAQTAS